MGLPLTQRVFAKLYAKLSARKLELETELKETFPDWEVKTPFTPKVNNKKLGYEKGVPTYKVKTVQFNPGSRDHVANRLTTLRGGSLPTILMTVSLKLTR